MYCTQCGSQLPPNARFCPNCGTQVHIEDSEMQDQAQATCAEDVASKVTDNPPDKDSNAPAVPRMFRVRFLGRILEFDPAVIECAKLKKRFHEHAQNAEKDFSSQFQEKVKDFDSLYDEGIAYFLQKIDESLDFGVSIAHEYGASLNKEQLLERTDGGNACNNALSYYLDIARKLSEAVGMVEDYRNQQHSDNRIQWSGGGFGIAGAIKGAVAASVLQLGTDALREVGRSALSYADRSRLKKLENEIYREVDHKSGLEAALLSWYKSELKTVASVLVEQNVLNEPALDSIAGMEFIIQADNIIDHASQDTPQSEYERAIDLICQGIPYDPFGSWAINAYCTLYKIPSTNKRMVLNFVKFFGMEQEYLEAKGNIEREILAPVLRMGDDSINEIDEKIAAAERLCATYTDIPISAILDGLKGKRNRLKGQQEQEARKAAEAKLAAERIEEQRNQDNIANEKKFRDIKALPEITLEQLRTKYDLLKILYPTTDIECEKGRVYKRFLEVGFMSAFPSGLDPTIYAHKLTNNIIFREICDQLDWNLEHTLRIVKQNTNVQISEYNIITQDDANGICRGYLKQKQSSFAPYGESEIPIMYVCETATDRGILLTNQKMYIRGEPSDAKPYSFPLHEISSIKVTDRVGGAFNYHFYYLVINQTPRIRVATKVMENLGCVRFIQTIEFFVNYCLFLASTHLQREEGFGDAVLRNAGLSHEAFQASRLSVQESDYFEQPSASTDSSSASSSGCFITSAVCQTLGKPDDCYELTLFRRFRDLWLAKQPDGQALIQSYYQVAPRIVAHIDKRNDSNEIYRSIWKGYLVSCLRHIEAQQFTECKNIYIAMVNKLARQYLAIQDGRCKFSVQKSQIRLESTPDL